MDDTRGADFRDAGRERRDVAKEQHLSGLIIAFERDFSDDHRLLPHDTYRKSIAFFHTQREDYSRFIAALPG